MTSQKHNLGRKVMNIAGWIDVGNDQYGYIEPDLY